MDNAQLELNVLTIQPDEAYLLYTEVVESWDSWYEEDRGEEYDGCTFAFGPGRYIRHETRVGAREKTITGVIVDDATLDIIKGRMDDYARNWEEKAIAVNANSTDKPNFEIKVTYTLEKVRRINL